jgi:hypothetical protein
LGTGNIRVLGQAASFKSKQASHASIPFAKNGWFYVLEKSKHFQIAKGASVW